MADTRQRTTWGSRFRFLVRALGLTGTAAVVVGGGLAVAALPPADYATWAGWKALPDTLAAAAQGAHGDLAKGAAWAVAGGLGAVALALVVEALGVLLTAGRRTAAGTTATVGAAAAVALLVLVNVYSFSHYGRFDTTRDRRFTLPPELAAELGKLRTDSPTTIVVLQMHSFGTLSPRRDSYTAAAEEKVAEKVRDLVDQFREFGPQFNVAVLDSEAFGYEEQLRQLTADSPELRKAIEGAPENSIFFHANKRVQRLSFNEFMQLDKSASRADGAENLVLLPQGVGAFARRVLAVQERRPRAAVCVVHEFLSTAVAEGTEQYTVAGMRKALTDGGFDVVDVVLKKNWEDNTKELEPAAYTLDESKLERLEAEADAARDAAQAARDEVKLLGQVGKQADEAQKLPPRERADFYNALIRGTRAREWTELLAALRRWSGAGQAMTAETEAELRGLIAAGVAAQTRRAEEQAREAEAEQREAEAKARAAQADERTAESRRVADVKAKLARLVADVDLLIVPRHTLVNAALRSGVPPNLHTLDKRQVEVVKEFMKAGKPVLACLGSVSTRTGPPAEPDGFEQLLRDRGVELGRDTVLFDAERKALASARAGGGLAGGGPTDLPPLVFADAAPAGAAPNPIARALRHTGRTVEQKLDVKLFAPRPVYLARGWQEKLSFAGEFVFTAPSAWNEERPFPAADAAGRVTYTPRYDPTPADDPKRNTFAEERKAAFPVGVAVEGKIPAAWVREEAGPEQAAAALLAPLDGGTFAALETAAAERLDRPVQRTVVFGSGHLFSGPRLEPPQEKLLLHAVNWLTARDDRLPTVDGPRWQYPRAGLSDGAKLLWRLGTAIGLPLAAAYLGLLATMRRRMR